MSKTGLWSPQLPYTQASKRVALTGIRLVIDEFRTDVTKTRNYPDVVLPSVKVGRHRRFVRSQLERAIVARLDSAL